MTIKQQLLANAKANRNNLGAEPQISVTRLFSVHFLDDYEEPAVIASRTGQIGSRQDTVLDTSAADAILAEMGFRRTEEWGTGDAPNLSPSGQWVAGVEELTT